MACLNELDDSYSFFHSLNQHAYLYKTHLVFDNKKFNITKGKDSMKPSCSLSYPGSKHYRVEGTFNPIVMFYVLLQEKQI